MPYSLLMWTRPGADGGGWGGAAIWGHTRCASSGTDTAPIDPEQPDTTMQADTAGRGDGPAQTGPSRHPVAVLGPAHRLFGAEICGSGVAALWCLGSPGPSALRLLVQQCRHCV